MSGGELERAAARAAAVMDAEIAQWDADGEPGGFILRLTEVRDLIVSAIRTESPAGSGAPRRSLHE